MIGAGLAIAAGLLLVFTQVFTVHAAPGLVVAGLTVALAGAVAMTDQMASEEDSDVSDSD